MALLDRIGARCHAKEGKRWRPTRSILWLGFVVVTLNGAAEIEERTIEKGVRLCEELFGAQPGTAVPARELIASVSFLGFLHWVTPGGFCHRRSGWVAVNEPGAMDQ